MTKINHELQAKLSVLLTSMGFELLGVELSGGGGRTIFRLYIDRADGVVTVDDCSQVSRQVSAMLDVEDPITGKYSLEVSSPGINRPLFTLDHFRKYIGCKIKVRLLTAIENRKQFKGLLQRIEGENIYLLVDGKGQLIDFAFNDVDKANLIGDIRW